jgi:hypothetical protein
VFRRRSPPAETRTGRHRCRGVCTIEVASIAGIARRRLHKSSTTSATTLEVRNPAGRTPGNVELDAGVWIKGGLEVLAERGIEGVRIEILAKMLVARRQETINASSGVSPRADRQYIVLEP